VVGYNLDSLMRKTKDELVMMLLEKEQISIPVSKFSSELGPLESVVKYLRDEKKLSIKEISVRLNRSDRTIWATYYSSKRISSRLISRIRNETRIPISIFSKEKSSILETLVYYLHRYMNMRFVEIAQILNRDVRTVWTCYSRYIKKNPNQKIMINMEEKK